MPSNRILLSCGSVVSSSSFAVPAMMQVFKPAISNAHDAILGIIKEAFPFFTFPRAALHEFFYTGAKDAASTCGFVSGILKCCN